VIPHLVRDPQEIGGRAQTREFDEHWQVYSRDDLDSILRKERHAQVRRGAAKHVRQDQYSGFPAHPFDGLCDLLSSIVHVVVPADRDGRKFRQVSNDHLGRVDQLGRQLSVGYNNHANHGSYRTPFLAPPAFPAVPALLPFVPFLLSSRLGLRDVPVPDPEASADSSKRPPEPLRDHDGTVTSAGAPDRDR
jgi:hypothetical protein